MRLLIFSLILISKTAHSYPTTIAKGYTSCATCHATSGGGTILNDYGRGMASAFMSTFSFEDEAREFLIDESPHFEIGADYRHLLLQSAKTGTVNFPMVLDFDGAVNLGNLTLAGSIGYYSRDRNFESRENYAQFKYGRTTIRGGYFMPVMGINHNDHSLAVKRIVGLSRGQEGYSLELHYRTKAFQAFYTATTKEFNFKNEEKNFYRLSTPEGAQAHRLRVSLLTIKRLEIGANYLTSESYNASGIFYKQSFFKNQYIFYETNWTAKESATYARLGYFFFNGLDTYLEYDSFKTSFNEDQNIYLGWDWMIRPRFELSLKINLTGDVSQYQTHLWL